MAKNHRQLRNNLIRTGGRQSTDGFQAKIKVNIFFHILTGFRSSAGFFHCVFLEFRKYKYDRVSSFASIREARKYRAFFCSQLPFSVKKIVWWWLLLENVMAIHESLLLNFCNDFINFFLN